jgi:hypothetical protein
MVFACLLCTETGAPLNLSFSSASFIFVQSASIILLFAIRKKKEKIALRIFSVIQNHVIARPLWDAHLVLKMDHHCGRGGERHLRLIMMVMKVRVVCGREDGKKLARGFY